MLPQYIKSLPLVVIAVFASLLAKDSFCQQAASQNALEELALRLLDHSPPGEVSPPPKLLVGSVPERLAAEIYVPKEARIIGSLVREETDATIVLNTKASPEKALSEYEQILSSRGWEQFRREMDARPGGFLPAEARNYWSSYRVFCREKARASLTIRANPRPDQTTDLYLTYSEKGERSLCNQTRGIMRARLLPGGRGEQPFGHDLIPPLYAPEGATSNQMGGGVGSPRSQNQFITLNTKLSASELLSHYGEQLEKAGWKPINRSVEGKTAWQSWNVQGDAEDPLQAFLLIIELPDEKPQRMVSLNLY
jgi:hypothetical protein